MCLVLLSFQTKQRPRNKLCFAEKINQEKNKFDDSEQESFSAHILQNIDFKQAENLLRANQNLNGLSDAMVTPEVDENVKDDIIFHAKFLLEVIQYLLAYITTGC